MIAQVIEKDQRKNDFFEGDGAGEKWKYAEAKLLELDSKIRSDFMIKRVLNETTQANLRSKTNSSWRINLTIRVKSG